MYCFILYISVALLIRPSHGRTPPSDLESEELQKPAVVDMKSLKNAAEIIQLLKIMNRGNVNKSNRQNSAPTGIDFDYLGASEEKSDIVNELMKMIKSSYHAKEKQVVRPNDRLIYISNPEVLEEYKMQQKMTRSSAEGGETGDGKSSPNENLLDILQHSRRSGKHTDPNNDLDAEKDKKVQYDENEDKTKENQQEEAEDAKGLGKSIDNPSREDTDTSAVKNKHKKIILRAEIDDPFETDEEKNKPFEDENDDYEIKTTKFVTKREIMKNSDEKPFKNSRDKKKEDKNRYKNNDPWDDDYSYNKKDRFQKKSKPQKNRMRDDVARNPPKKFIQQPKAKAKPNRVRERGRDRGRQRERESNNNYHSYGRTPVPFVGKRGIYEEEEKI